MAPAQHAPSTSARRPRRREPTRRGPPATAGVPGGRARGGRHGRDHRGRHLQRGRDRDGHARRRPRRARTNCDRTRTNRRACRSVRRPAARQGRTDAARAARLDPSAAGRACARPFRGARADPPLARHRVLGLPARHALCRRTPGGREVHAGRRRRRPSARRRRRVGGRPVRLRSPWARRPGHDRTVPRVRPPGIGAVAGIGVAHPEGEDAGGRHDAGCAVAQGRHCRAGPREARACPAARARLAGTTRPPRARRPRAAPTTRRDAPGSALRLDRPARRPDRDPDRGDRSWTWRRAAAGARPDRRAHRAPGPR